MKELLNKLGVNADYTHLIMVLFIIVFTLLIIRFGRWIFDKAFNKDRVSPDEITRLSFIKNGLSFMTWLLAFAWIIYTIPKLRQMAVTIFAGAGIFVAILGIASQQAFSNIVSGIFIVMFRPFRIGDMIKVGDNDYGNVEEITLRHTVIKDFKNKRIIIPNSVVSTATIVNESIEDPKSCRWFEMSISYDADIDKAMQIMEEEILKHPKWIDIRTPVQIHNNLPKVPIKVISFGESSVILRAWIWSDDFGNAFFMHCDLNKSIKERFDKAGIEIPFPYRTIVYKDKNAIPSV